MGALLGLSKGIDTINEWVGKGIMWLVLAAVVISAGNAIMRKAFDIAETRRAWRMIHQALHCVLQAIGRRQ